MRKSFVCRASCLAIKGFHKAASLEKMIDLEYFFNTIVVRFPNPLAPDIQADTCQLGSPTTLLMKDSNKFWNVRWQISFSLQPNWWKIWNNFLILDGSRYLLRIWHFQTRLFFQTGLKVNRVSYSRTLKRRYFTQVFTVMPWKIRHS